MLDSFSAHSKSKFAYSRFCDKLFYHAFADCKITPGNRGVTTYCGIISMYYSHRSPRDNQRDREQQTLLKSIGSKYLSGNNLPRIILARCFPTGIYTILPPVDLIAFVVVSRVGCLGVILCIRK